MRVNCKWRTRFEPYTEKVLDVLSKQLWEVKASEHLLTQVLRTLKPHKQKELKLCDYSIESLLSYKELSYFSLQELYKFAEKTSDEALKHTLQERFPEQNLQNFEAEIDCKDYKLFVKGVGPSQKIAPIIETVKEKRIKNYLLPLHYSDPCMSPGDLEKYFELLFSMKHHYKLQPIHDIVLSNKFGTARPDIFNTFARRAYKSKLKAVFGAPSNNQLVNWAASLDTNAIFQNTRLAYLFDQLHSLRFYAHKGCNLCSKNNFLPQTLEAHCMLSSSELLSNYTSYILQNLSYTSENTLLLVPEYLFPEVLKQLAAPKPVNSEAPTDSQSYYLAISFLAK